MIAYSDSDATANGSIFSYFDSDSTATADPSGWITCCSSEPDIYKTEEDDLWMIIDYREWKAYLKSLWFAVLREKQANSRLWLGHRQYCMRQMLSFSGWIARVGYRKKRN